MQPIITVTPPENMNHEWVFPPTPACASRYTVYFHNRKLLAESEGWTTWAARLLAKHAFSVVQTGATYFYRGITGFVAGAAVRNDLAYHATGKVVQAAHGVFIAWSRTPVDHDRVDKAIEKLHHIGLCSNPEAFIERIEAVYNKGYLSSKGSADLMKTLRGYHAAVDKISAIAEYLKRPAVQPGFQDIRYNNGKWLYQVIVCMAENSKLDLGK